MKQMLRAVIQLLSAFGINPVKTVKSIRGLPRYFSDLREFRRSRSGSRDKDKFRSGRPYPCLDDRFAQSGSVKGHYFHQDLLVARRIFEDRPDLHVDAGSRIDGFVAHVAAYRKIEVFDIRPLPAGIPNVKFIKSDLMAEMDAGMADYCDSLSCLHALEHFGLGRYGDTVKYDGTSTV